jgi:hypothetical protein
MLFMPCVACRCQCYGHARAVCPGEYWVSTARFLVHAALSFVKSVKQRHFVLVCLPSLFSTPHSSVQTIVASHLHKPLLRVCPSRWHAVLRCAGVSQATAASVTHQVTQPRPVSRPVTYSAATSATHSGTPRPAAPKLRSSSQVMADTCRYHGRSQPLSNSSSRTNSTSSIC